MKLKTVRPLSLLSLAGLLAFLVVAPQAQAQDGIVKEILVSVQDMDSKEIIAELREGDTLRLRSGDRVRLRLVAEPQNKNRSRHYPEGSFELHNAAGMVTLKDNPKRGSAVVSAIRSVSRSKPGATPFIRYVVTRPMKMDKKHVRGTLYVAIEGANAVQPAPPIAAPAPPRPQDRQGITLYEHQDFQGRSERFTAADVNVNNNIIGADRASSVRVDPGCKVTLYEHPEYKGKASVLTGDETDLRRTRVGSDTVSSLELDCRAPGTWGSGSQDRRQDSRDQGYQPGVTFFEHQDFRGRSESLYADDSSFNDNSLRHDSASSVRIDPGCRVVLYEHPNFQGRATVLTEDEADLGRTRVGNDSVSSAEIECRSQGRQDRRTSGGQDPRDRGYRAGVTLFEHQDFRGRSETFYGDDANFNDNSLRHDSASSVRVDPGCRVVLYEHPNFDGRASVLTADEVDLGRTRVGNDTVSSIEVRCNGR